MPLCNFVIGNFQLSSIWFLDSASVQVELTSEGLNQPLTIFILC